MSEDKKFIELPKKQKPAKELRQWLNTTGYEEKHLVILVAMELRNFAFEQIIWARNEEASGLGLFDSADPYESATCLIEKLRIFGFLAPEVKEMKP